MQTLSASLTAALLTIDATTTPRVLVDLYEFYESDYVPGVSGFDPADAIEAFAAETITWNGQAYRREVVSRGDVTRNLGEKTNQCTLSFSNISRYMATLATTQQIEGLFLVIRTVVPSVTDDSIVLFVGRCDKPSDINKEKFTLNARQDFGNINQEIPPREFTPEDPNGRTPSDLLYEGFRISGISGTLQIPVETPSTSFFGRLFGRTNTTYETRQYSSLDGTPYGGVVPIIFGRCQMELIPIFFVDVGVFLWGVWVVGEGRVDDFTDVKFRNSRFVVTTTSKNLGDPGGTGTNNVNTAGPINQGYLSKTAYTVITTSAQSTIEDQDEAPLVTAIVRGVRVPLPNSSGVYGAEEWTDNPVHLARFILTDPRLVRIDPGFMEDTVNHQTALHCDEPIFDDSNGDVTLIAQADQPQGGTGIRRSRSTGILDARHYLFNDLGDTSIVPEFEDPQYTAFDPGDIPTTFAIQRFLRKRYTCSVPFTEKIRAVDALYKVIFPCAKLFLRINKRGKYEIRSERPSDATMIRAATAVNATAILVQDVTPWKSGDLLQGRIQIGFGLLTSEVRDVSSATYSADGNAFTLTTGVTGGGVTSVASGATLAGGSTTVQASGTITVGGAPAAGNTITVTINGVAVVYTLTSDDTTGTVAAQLAAYINATPKLRRLIRATWLAASPTIVTITALLGVLNVSALLKAHTAPIADPGAFTSALSALATGSLANGTYTFAYADVTAIGKTALSATSQIVLSGGVNDAIRVGAGAAFPAGVIARYFYMSDAASSEYLRYVAVVTSNIQFDILTVPLPGAALPPQYNTTGEEVIRIAMSFATNSQDVYSVWPASTAVILSDIYLPSTPNGHKYQVSTAGTTGASEPTWPLTAGGTVASGTAVFTEIGATVLGQAGLTRANIKKGTFSFPLGSRQSSVNQVKISYRDANNDFAKTPFRVNDRAHQELVNKIYPMEVNGEAIDNFHQMYRIANWQLAKNREGDWFYTFGTGPQGLVLEEGDVICASDDSGGLINIPTRIEELRIHPNHDVTIGQARKYSTNMFSDDVGADIIPVPTSLRYIQTVDSLVEFIDNFPIRDADGLVGGFYVAISRDLTIEGDWRGWDLYADYGDGYVLIASGDIPAIMGVATTTLGTVTDATIMDKFSSVTFTLKYGPPPPASDPFASVTWNDLFVNPYRNLFLVGDEYVQARDVVNNGNQSYTISRFLRGRFGTDTDELAHGASERVIFINGAEQFIEIPLSALNKAYDYKVKTTNQDLADAAAVPFTWTGGNLKPLRVVNSRGTRGSDDDLLTEFEGRTRIGGGVRSFQAGALNEESEEYRLQILDTGSETLPNGMTRIIPVTIGMEQPAVLVSDSVAGKFVGVGVGSNNLDGGAGLFNAVSLQRIHFPGSHITATVLAAQSSPEAQIAFIPAGIDWRKKTVSEIQALAQIAVHYSELPSGGTGFSIFEYGVSKFNASSFPNNSTRVRLEFFGSAVRVYTGWTGPGSIPLYESPIAVVFPVVAIAQVNHGDIDASVEDVVMTTIPFPKIVYSKAQQVEDFGSAQSAIQMDIWQHSPVVGPGVKTRVTL